MDEAKTRSHVEAHGDAVVRGDAAAVVADFSDQSNPQIPQIGRALPRPVTAAEVLSVEFGDDQAVADVKYSGESKVVTVRSRWQDVSGRPMIVDAELVD
jgi:hypothetical protein